MQKLAEIENVSVLTEGMDFRKYEYRREVFLRFYEFHDRYKAHPGAVYYAMPYLFKRFNLTTEQKLWVCFLNGVCQNILTTWEIFDRFSNVPVLKQDFDLLSLFFRENYTKFGWDIDRRYVKNQFEKCVQSYINNLNGRTQEEYFGNICKYESPHQNFDALWDIVSNNFYLFGRLSTFSYLEYLRIAGVNIECSNLFMYDLKGSTSHRNGLCKILGRDDMDWHKSNPEFKPYTQQQLQILEYEGEVLLNEAKQRGIDASYFTLESTLCCYKSWYRKNRRYPNVYNDMFYDRILKNEQGWQKTNHLFRELRQECLPSYLLVENNPYDPGLKPIKQNHFRETGEVIMMDLDWPCFKNSFNTKYFPQDDTFQLL
jgi:hypothetical protein